MAKTARPLVEWIPEDLAVCPVCADPAELEEELREFVALLPPPDHIPGLECWNCGGRRRLLELAA